MVLLLLFMYPLGMQPILPNSQLFQSFPTEAGSAQLTQNGQFCLIHNFSNLLPLNVSSEWSAWTYQFLPVFTVLFQSLSYWIWLRMTQNMPILPLFAAFPIFSHWSGSECLRTAQITCLIITIFPILIQKWSNSFFEWLRNGQSHLICNFSNLVCTGKQLSNEVVNQANFAQFKVLFQLLSPLGKAAGIWLGIGPILPDSQLHYWSASQCKPAQKSCKSGEIGHS